MIPIILEAEAGESYFRAAWVTQWVYGEAKINTSKLKQASRGGIQDNELSWTSLLLLPPSSPYVGSPVNRTPLDQVCCTESPGQPWNPEPSYPPSLAPSTLSTHLLSVRDASLDYTHLFHLHGTWFQLAGLEIRVLELYAERNTYHWSTQSCPIKPNPSESEPDQSSGVICPQGTSSKFSSILDRRWPTLLYSCPQQYGIAGANKSHYSTSNSSASSREV